MRHITRKRLGRLLMLLDAARQSFERARQIANLIALTRSFESSAQSSAAIENRTRFATQLSQRTNDRRAHHERQHDRERERHDKDLENRQADRMKLAANFVRRS